MKIIVATTFFFVLTFVAMLNEIMIAEIEYQENYSFKPSWWQQHNRPYRYCPEGDVYLECKKYKGK